MRNKKEMAEVTRFFINVFKACYKYGESDLNNNLEDCAIINSLFHWTDVRDHPEWYGVRKINLAEEGINEYEAMEEVITTMASKYLGIEDLWHHPLWTQPSQPYTPTLHEYLVQNYDYHPEVIKELEKEVIEFYNLYKDDIKIENGDCMIPSEGLWLTDAIWNHAPLFCNSTIGYIVEKLYKKEIKL